MDNETVVAVSNIAETITSIGILLIWVWAERRDNQNLFHIIQALTNLRLRQIERQIDNIDSVDEPVPGKRENP